MLEQEIIQVRTSSIKAIFGWGLFSHVSAKLQLSDGHAAFRVTDRVHLSQLRLILSLEGGGGGIIFAKINNFCQDK
jgi:hypothetical protein